MKVFSNRGFVYSSCLSEVLCDSAETEKGSSYANFSAAHFKRGPNPKIEMNVLCSYRAPKNILEKFKKTLASISFYQNSTLQPNSQKVELFSH